jgi:tetratricopeptide (TPR) repeat protein
MGMTLADLGHASEGFKILDLSLKVEPTNHISMLYRGIIHYDLGNLEAASEELETAISQCAKSNDAYHLEEALRKRGNVLEDLGDFKSAATNYALAMELRPHDPIFVSARALCLIELGLYTKAGVLLVTASKMYHEEGDETSSHHCLEEVNKCKKRMAERRLEREKLQVLGAGGKGGVAKPKRSPTPQEQKGARPGSMSPAMMKQKLAEAEERVAKQKRENTTGGLKMFGGLDKPSTKQQEAEKMAKINNARASMKDKKQRPPSMSREEMKQKLAEAEARVAREKKNNTSGGLKMFGGFDRKVDDKAASGKRERIQGARTSIRQKRQQTPMTPEEMKMKLLEAEARVKKQKESGGKGVKMFKL